MTFTLFYHVGHQTKTLGTIQANSIGEAFVAGLKIVRTLPFDADWGIIEKLS